MIIFILDFSECSKGAPGPVVRHRGHGQQWISSRSRLDVNIVAELVHNVISAKSILPVRDRSEILINTTISLTGGREWPMAVRNTRTCVTERAREAERVLDMVVGASSRASQILLPLLIGFKAGIAGTTGNTLGWTKL